MNTHETFQVLPNGGVTSPKGFRANGLHCGLKRSGKPDLSLIYSNTPCAAACVYTKNSIKAAPLLVTKEHLRHNRAQAIITNSGNANCFTGEFGILYARKTAETLAPLLKIKTTDVVVSSTGIIGKPLPVDLITAACPALVNGLTIDGGKRAAEGIMTTDTFTKEISVRFTLHGKPVTIGACAKGSGMIAPDMATMLAYVTTDIAISTGLLKKALKTVVGETFNCISVDGCMSTNDMLVVLANGQAGNKLIAAEGSAYKAFLAALHFVCQDLAKKIVLDGEGATKFIEIFVQGAKTPAQAKKIALAVANSSLVKTAAFGCNPNWGRVAAAVGSLGLPISEKDLKIDFSSFAEKEIKITVSLNLGKAVAKIYTCDFSLEYVQINGRYN